MTSISIRAVGFCVLTIVAALLSGCVTTVNVPVPVTMPAEIDMSPYKRIALAEVKENLGSDFRITSSRIFCARTASKSWTGSGSTRF